MAVPSHKNGPILTRLDTAIFSLCQDTVRAHVFRDG